MIGIYLSGTGNTKHCVEKLVSLLDAAAECIPLEAPHITDTLEKQRTIILGYPTQFSNAPFMVCEFIRKNRLPVERQKCVLSKYNGTFQRRRNRLCGKALKEVWRTNSRRRTDENA